MLQMRQHQRRVGEGGRQWGSILPVEHRGGSSQRVEAKHGGRRRVISRGRPGMVRGGDRSWGRWRGRTCHAAGRVRRLFRRRWWRLLLLLLLLVSDTPRDHGLGANFFVRRLAPDTAFHELIAQPFAPGPLPAIGRVHHHENVDVGDARKFHGGFQQNINEERLHALPLLDDAQKAGRLNGSRRISGHDDGG